VWRSQAKALDSCLSRSSASPCLPCRTHARDAEFSDLVHFLGADLQLDALVPDRSRWCGANVVVLLRRRDVVLKRPGTTARWCDDAECAVAGFDIGITTRKPKMSDKLLEADRFALHLVQTKTACLRRP